MILRRLKQDEHGLTRKLWEEVFPEDTKAFLDYYYFIKTKENRIYVIEEDGEIRSMLQLNRYRIRIEAGEFPSDYIIAVSTQKEYRSRGYMGKLLRTSLAEMYQEKVPFTFLMPAAAEIYTPYDFRYIYSQRSSVIDLTGKNGDDNDTTSGEAAGSEFSERDAAIFDAEEMARFFNQNFADRWQVASARDEAYYRTMILEQQSEHGGVRLLFSDKELIGMFAYAAEDGMEIREPLILPGRERCFEQSAAGLAGGRYEKIKVYGYPDAGIGQEKPLIMARIVHLPTLFAALRVSAAESLDCSFAVLDPILHQNSRIWRLRSLPGEETVSVSETEDSEGVIPVAELTEFLFGRRSADEIRENEDVIITERLQGELEKIRRLDRVFLNEVV